MPILRDHQDNPPKDNVDINLIANDIYHVNEDKT